MIEQATETRVVHTFDSLDDLVNTVQAVGFTDKNRQTCRADFTGIAKPEYALAKARDGVPAGDSDPMDGVNLDSLSGMIEQPVLEYGVSGCSVDIGRYLTGEPECMLDFRVQDVRSNRVVRVVSSWSVNADVTVDRLEHRGRQVMALIDAIDTAGLQSELWVEFLTEANGYSYRCKVRIKSAGEVMDPDRVRYGMQDVSMYRVLMFRAMELIPTRFHKPLRAFDEKGHAAVTADDGHGWSDDDDVFLPPLNGNGYEDEDVVTPALRKLGLIE